MKHSLRKEILKERDRLSEKERREKSNRIKEKLSSLPDYKKAKTVCFYASFGSEVITHEMIREALQEKEVCAPVVFGNQLVLAKINDFSDLDSKNKFGILEPSSIIEIDKAMVDIILVPGIAFDSHGHRIGYGLGYYDTLLRGYDGLGIGLCFQMQLIDKIPAKGHDVRVRKVVTEKEVIETF